MSIKIIPLSEGAFTIGHDKHLVPFNPAVDILEDRPSGSLLVEIQPFLVSTKDKNILLDTGLGYSLSNGELQLHANLRFHGFEPGDIDMVLLSHLHKDHAGGISHHNVLGIQELSFPNATYYVSQHEFEYGMRKGFPSYTVETFEILKNSPQVEWLKESGNIWNFITYQNDGGHCPYHTSFRINSDSERIFYGGDVAPQMKQLKTKYIAKYDMDGRRSMELRQEYARLGKLEGWTFLFYHDVRLPFGKI